MGRTCVVWVVTRVLGPHFWVVHWPSGSNVISGQIGIPQSLANTMILEIDKKSWIPSAGFQV